MAVIDSDNFIAHLIWSGLIDKATCGELKEAIELCTVKDTYTKADMVAMLTELLSEIEEMQSREDWCDYATDNCIDRCGVDAIIRLKINVLKGEQNDESI